MRFENADSNRLNAETKTQQETHWGLGFRIWGLGLFQIESNSKGWLRPETRDLKTQIPKRAIRNSNRGFAIRNVRFVQVRFKGLAELLYINLRVIN